MINPFIELFRDPVTTLAALGYALLLASLIIWTLGLAWTNAVTIHHRWHDERPREWEYVPPLSFIARVAAIPLILWIDAWALAALIWLIA